MIRDVLMYVDRSYVENSRVPIKRLYDLAMDLFRENITDDLQIQEYLKATMLNFVAQERHHIHVAWLVFKSYFFITLGFHYVVQHKCC